MCDLAVDLVLDGDKPDEEMLEVENLEPSTSGTSGTRKISSVSILSGRGKRKVGQPRRQSTPSAKPVPPKPASAAKKLKKDGDWKLTGKKAD